MQEPVYYILLFAGSFTGTRFMPHFGHFPGFPDTTSGCMGQVYCCACSAAGPVGVVSTPQVFPAQQPSPANSGSAKADMARRQMERMTVVFFMVDKVGN